jgi:hypothetical protein
MCNVSILLIFGLEVFKFAFEIMNFEDFVHKSYSLLCGEKHAWRHNIHDIGSKCCQKIFIFSMQSTCFCRKVFSIMAKKCCGIFLNVLVRKKIGKFCETFKTKKLKEKICM